MGEKASNSAEVAGGGAQRAFALRPAVLVVPCGLCDDPAVAQAIGDHERNGSARFELVPSPGALAERMEGARSALVLCDLTSSGRAALDVLRSLRARGLSQPFLLLAAAGDREAARAASKLESCRVLRRSPLDAATLAAAVSRALGVEALLRTPTPAPHSAQLAPAMLWKTDAQGSFTHFTRRWTVFTGRVAELERGAGWLDGVHPDDQASWRSAYETALAAHAEFRCELRMRAASQEYRWVRHHGIPCFDASRAFSGYVGSSFEIDDLKRALDEHEASAHAAGHDLQEPLRNLEHTLKQIEAPEELSARALGLVARMRDLTRDLLEYSGAGRRPLALETIEARSAVEWALGNLRKLVDETSGRVEIEDLPRVQADPLQLGRVFQNLIANALRFHGEADPRVQVGGRRRAAETLFWVRDNGPGIPPDDHENIFAIFRRLHGPEVAGTGAGLAICRRIVERHRGRIWVESEPGRGATFFFTMP